MSAAVATVRRLFVEPIDVGERRLPPIGLTVLAAIGAVLLVVVAYYRWPVASDEFAYWLAAERLIGGQPLYDPAAVPATPYAYWYPPPLAQVLAPLTLFVPDWAYVAGWTGVLLACLWWLGGQHPLRALALVAVPFVAVELWFRNVHLVLAVLVVLALRRSPLFWIAATAIKMTPVLGIVYLAAAGRWRSALAVAGLGGIVLVVSVLAAPDAWSQFITVVVGQATTTGGSLIAVPYPVRLVVAAAMAIVAGRAGGLRGEVILVIALVVGNPSLWATAFSLLIAIVPLSRTADRT